MLMTCGKAGKFELFDKSEVAAAWRLWLIGKKFLEMDLSAEFLPQNPTNELRLLYGFLKTKYRISRIFFFIFADVREKKRLSTMRKVEIAFETVCHAEMRSNCDAKIDLNSVVILG
jgi:hypothetical protein